MTILIIFQEICSMYDTNKCLKKTSQVFVATSSSKLSPSDEALQMEAIEAAEAVEAVEAAK